MTAAAEPSIPCDIDRWARANPNVPSSSGAREVRCEHSLDLARLLGRLNASLLVWTYQAGKLAVIGSQEEQLALSFHDFDRPTGVAMLGKLAFVGQFECTSGVEEIFDVSLLPGARLTAVLGPFASEDGEKTIWRVPAHGQLSQKK